MTSASAERRQVTWSSQAKKVRLHHPILSVFVYLLVARFAAGQTVSLQDYSLVNCDKSLCQSQKCSNLTKSVVFRRLVVLLLLLKGTNKTQQQGIIFERHIVPIEQDRCQSLWQPRTIVIAGHCPDFTDFSTRLQEIRKLLLGSQTLCVHSQHCGSKQPSKALVLSCSRTPVPAAAWMGHTGHEILRAPW